MATFLPLTSPLPQHGSYPALGHARLAVLVGQVKGRGSPGRVLHELEAQAAHACAV